MKFYNIYATYKYLCGGKRYSRAEIAAGCGFSDVTAGAAVSELISAGLADETLYRGVGRICALPLSIAIIELRVGGFSADFYDHRFGINETFCTAVNFSLPYHDSLRLFCNHVEEKCLQCHAVGVIIPPKVAEFSPFAVTAIPDSIEKFTIYSPEPLERLRFLAVGRKIIPSTIANYRCL